MKHLPTLLLLLILGVSTHIQAQEISPDQTNFVSKFVTAVQKHKRRKVIKMLDKTYRNEQIAFLEGNKDQFLNELFGGEDISTGKSVFANIEFDKIKKIEIVRCTLLEDEKYQYYFHLIDDRHDVHAPLLLNTKGKFGFIGSVG